MLPYLVVGGVEQATQNSNTVLTLFSGAECTPFWKQRAPAICVCRGFLVASELEQFSGAVWRKRVATSLP